MRRCRCYCCDCDCGDGFDGADERMRGAIESDLVSAVQWNHSAVAAVSIAADSLEDAVDCPAREAWPRCVHVLPQPLPSQLVRPML